MKYKVALSKSDEGYSVSVPGLPGCWSQGQTEQEALANIEEAIREYLEVAKEQLNEGEMREVDGVNHLDAVRALEKAGFRIARQGRHIVMTNGARIITIPRHNPVNAFTMAGIVRDAGMTIERFRELL